MAGRRGYDPRRLSGRSELHCPDPRWRALPARPLGWLPAQLGGPGLQCDAARALLGNDRFLRLLPPQPVGRGVRAYASSRPWRAARWRSCPRISRPCSAKAPSTLEPFEVRDRVRELHLDRRAFVRQSKRATGLVGKRFGPAAHVERLKNLIGRPRRAVRAASIARGKRHILFFTSNGVGIGHLTRMLAVARRCPTPLQPVFLTLSQAVRIVREQGFLVEYLPFHASLDCDIQLWNKSLREELNELIGFYDPPVLLFDGHVPYQGLVDALRRQPGSAVGLVPARHVATRSRHRMPSPASGISMRSWSQAIWRAISIVGSPCKAARAPG